MAEGNTSFILQPEGMPWFALFDTNRTFALGIQHGVIDGLPFTDFACSRGLEDVLVWRTKGKQMLAIW